LARKSTTYTHGPSHCNEVRSVYDRTIERRQSPRRRPSIVLPSASMP